MRSASPPLVLVRWEDASFALDNEEGDHPCYVQTVGWLIGSTARAVRLADERLSGGRWRGVTRIPRTLVRSMTRLYSGDPA